MAKDENGIEHMRAAAFDLKVKDDGTIVITIKPDPHICCMECIGKQLMSFAEYTAYEQVEVNGDIGLN